MMGRTRRSCADWCGSMAAWLPTSIYFPVSASQLPAQGSVQPDILEFALKVVGELQLGRAELTQLFLGCSLMPLMFIWYRFCRCFPDNFH